MLIELPYVYQAEALYPRKRKTTIVNILDTSIFEMDSSDAEDIAISIAPNKKYYREQGDIYINEGTLLKKTDYGLIMDVRDTYNQTIHENDILISIINNNLPTKIKEKPQINLQNKTECINLLNKINGNSLKNLIENKIINTNEAMQIKKIVSDNSQAKINDEHLKWKNYFCYNSNIYKKNNDIPSVFIVNAPSYNLLNEYNIQYQIISDVSKKDYSDDSVRIPIGYLDIIEKYTQLIEKHLKQKTKQEHNNILIINPDIDLEKTYGKPEKIILESVLNIINRPSFEKIITNTTYGKNIISLIEHNLNNNCPDDLMEQYYYQITLFEKEIENTINTRGDFLSNRYNYMMILQRLKDMKYMKTAIEYYYDKKDKNQLKNIMKGDENNVVIFENQYIDFQMFSKKELSIGNIKTC